jgi:hypothetical protein
VKVKDGFLATTQSSGMRCAADEIDSSRAAILAAVARCGRRRGLLKIPIFFVAN